MRRPEAPSPAQEAARRGMRAVTGDSFSLGDAVGGVRGVVETVLPGLLFVVAFVVTTDLGTALVVSVVAALVAVAVRLVQRTPVTQAAGGILGIVVGVVWAWRSDSAENFYAPGLWTNAAYLVAFLVSILVRWPLVGLFVEALRAGFGDTGGARTDRPADARDGVDGAEDVGSERVGADAAADGDGVADDPDDPDDASPSPWAGLTAWRSDAGLVRRYTIASWFWVGLFAVRLAVKVPLYLSEEVGWLGTMHLVLGVPLWGLVLWLTWVVVRPTRRLDDVVEPSRA
ncbi:DUF3159 domain-containing protein [Isoptericola jiangsuensis]|uniref:DUF3159 domain-containing protein n=1 Tax=Isoptericola jiangsuensis TaxID=548579 RepID=UPI003AAE0012